MNKAKLSRWLGAAVAVLVLTSFLRAEDVAGPPQPYCVIIGISKYKDANIKSRVHGEDDAKALYDLFTDKKYLGVDAKHVRLLLGSEDAQRAGKMATRDNILKALKWLTNNARAKDPVIFAFIGNGGPAGDLGDRRVYFAADSTFKDRKKNAIATSEITDALKDLKSKHFAAFLDVNFKGFVGEGLVGLGDAPYREFLGDDDSEDHIPLPGRVVFMATNGLSNSIDLKDHGLFTTALLEGLKGAADKEGYEPDGSITVDELGEFLDKRIPRLAAEHGKTKEEKNQLHFVLGGRANHFVLTHNPAAAEETKARLEKLENLLKDGKIPEKLAAEARLYLEHMPRLEAQRAIRKEYQQLVDGKIKLDTFETRRDTILEGTRMREVDAVRFAAKVIEASQMIKEGYVKEVKQSDLIVWAIKGLYRRIEEKIPEDVDAKLKKAKGMNEEELTKLLSEVRLKLGKREDLDKHKDLDIALQRMLVNLDPYTTYIDQETSERFLSQVQGNFKGIGIQIRKDNASDMLVVVTPIKGSPAYKAGLQAGDVITKITRFVDDKGKELETPEETSTKGLALNDAVKKIKGKENTKVKLTVQREGESDPKDFEITRGVVMVDSVLGFKRLPNDEWDFMLDKENKIGYIRLTEFTHTSSDEIKRVMKKLVAKGIKGFVFDLRFNPGGTLTGAVDITDLFIGDGLIVSVRPRVGRETKFNGQMEGSLLDFPMVCLVNGGSASGSEIVSAALQDHNRAYIIGERSYGKGSVQNISPFEGGELKMTTASFWRPSGKNLNKSSTLGRDEDTWGVTPDKIVPLTRKERDELEEAQRNSEIIQRKGPKPSQEEKNAFKDKQLDSALDYLRGQIKLGARLAGKKVG
jgi:carboxyl-terminal processing protease